MDTPCIKCPCVYSALTIVIPKAGCFAVHVPAVEPNARLPPANLDQGWRDLLQERAMESWGQGAGDSSPGCSLTRQARAKVKAVSSKLIST